MIRQALRMVVVASILIGRSNAGNVQSWRQENEKDFSAGTLNRLVVNSEGHVELSRQLKALADLNAGLCWSVAVLPSSDLIAALGNPGAVAKVAADGNVTVLHKDEKQQFFAVTPGPDGSVYAAASPSGVIWRIPERGKPESFYSTGDTYVWSLATDAAGNLYAATGDKGRLHQIKPDGKGKVLFQAKQPHFLVLAVEASGTAHVGTSKEGIVYRVHPDGSVYVEYDAPQADVSSLLLAENGVLYVGTGTPARPTFPSGMIPSRGVGEPGLGGELRSSMQGLNARAKAGSENAPPARKEAGGESSAPAKDKRETTKGTPADSPGRESEKAATPSFGGASSTSGSTTSSGSSSSSSASPGENSVYRIEANGAASEIFREKCLVLSLALLDGKLLVGTGTEGKLFAVDPATHVKSEIARLEHGTVASLAKQKDGSVVLGAGNPAKLHALDDRYAATGELLSSVHDAKLPTRWGKYQKQATAPERTSLDLAFRTGNIADPDATWTPWSSDPTTLPRARFLQYKLTLRSDGGSATPSLHDLVMYYSPVNLPPRLTKIETPPLDKPASVGTGAPSKITFRWQAVDPNADTLTYHLELKREGWPEWITLAKDLSKAEHEWDPTSAPSGEYHVRVSASDEASNRQGEALRDERVSERFLIDREPPALRMVSSTVVGKKGEVKIDASDAKTRLSSAAYSVDGKPWQPLLPDDGIFDSTAESFSFATQELDVGAHVVMIKVLDAAGQTAAIDTLLRVP